MGTFNLSAVSEILKDGWLPLVKNDINLEAKIYQYFRKSTEPFQAGNNWFIRFKTAYNESFGWTADGGSLPPPGNPTYDKFTITPKYAYSQFKITNQTISRGRGSLNAMKDTLMAIKEDTTEAAIKRMNQAFFGDGTAKLGSISAVDSNVSLTFNRVAGNATGDKRYAARYFNGNEKIAIHDGSNNTVRGTTTATAINHNTNVLLVPNTQGADATATSDFACLALQGSDQSSFNKAVWGLEYHVDNGDNIITYQGLTRANVERAKATVIDNGGTDRPLTLSLLEELTLSASIKSNARTTDKQMLWCETSMRTKYIELLQGQIRYVPMTLKGGTKKDLLAYNDIPIDVDDDCTYGTWYCICPENFSYHILDDWQFDETSGSVLKLTGGSDNLHVFYAILYSYMNLSCDRPKAQTKLTDITQTVISG